MKAPDKIYVEVCEDGIFAFPEPPFAESVEYIRADIGKQPAEGLDAEIDACWQNWLSPSNQKEVDGVLPKTEFAMYAHHFAEWGRKQVLQEIYEGKVKPVDKITAAWLDDEPKAREEK